MRKFLKEIYWGTLGALGLLGFYLLITKLTGMPSSQIWALWPWILVLTVGFGIQVGLYTHLRSCQKGSDGKVVATSGGISGLGMVACCAHHLTEVLPILGLSAAALFLVQYQTWFLALGVVSNLLGIGYLGRRVLKFPGLFL